MLGKASAQVVPKTNQTLTAGEVLTLTCKVNRETVNITWKKDGKSFKERAAIFTRLSERRSKLVITEVVEEESGEYSCEARNKLGSVAHSSVILDVKGKASAQVFPATHHSLRAGEVLTLTCKVNRETVNITWKKDGESLKERAVIDTRLNERKSKLVITEVVEEDSGEYSCEASNKLGTVAQSSVILGVKVSPQIIAPLTDQSVTEGYPVNFSCVASGVPIPTIVWDFNNGDLPSGVNQTDQEGESVLELPRVTKEMEGTYNCKAKNKENTASSSAALRVYEKASAQVIPETDLTLTTGEVLTLTCLVNEETVKITWKKDGESLKERAVVDTRSNKTKRKLVITEVVEEDSGEYSCEASNKLGTVAHSSVILDVKEAPSSSSLEWYYIGGPVAAVIFLLALTAYIKNRRATALQEVPTRLSEEHDEVEMDQLKGNTDGWEIAVDRLNFREPIGRGAFGSVWRALLGRSRGRPGNRTVAAKCYLPISGEQGRRALLREIELLKLFGRMGHENVVKFIGCVTVG
ncbi:vascular endothelial growth factor receptor 1-like, partial [Stylophora pistillata]|uniref:vascular endothelial growth factor receptor 1-like n=1 Tax=Stylophora pistillata TaxID=50429 RepID=UPI000C04ADC9